MRARDEQPQAEQLAQIIVPICRMKLVQGEWEQAENLATESLSSCDSQDHRQQMIIDLVPLFLKNGRLTLAEQLLSQSTEQGMSAALLRATLQLLSGQLSDARALLEEPNNADTPDIRQT